MKRYLFCGFLFSALFGNAQESFRIQDVPRFFRNPLSGNNQLEKINDSLSMKINKQGVNYKLTLEKNSGSELCSCLYKLNGNPQKVQGRRYIKTASGGTQVKDSVLTIQLLEPVKENCLAKYRTEFIMRRARAKP